MCGRYTLFTPAADLEARFDADFDGHEPSYNCAPGQSLPVITDEDPATATQMEWGLTPQWADEPFDLINARAETVREKRSFADAFERRRCLVPADGFYEWVERSDGTAGRSSGKRPYRVAFADDRPFAMAGIYERWEPPEPATTQTGLDAFGDASDGGAGDGDTSDDGTDAVDDGSGRDVVETFTIVTTEPNDLVADLHHRMAVILSPDEEATWLRGDPGAAADLLDPHPDDDMTAHPVSTRVNSPAVDAPKLIEPVGAE
ncbi:SOS response-associated peptidase [Halorubrum sp. BV1]|uniref:SOS response-associated peptidase n=1 Tax=Halorubrum sp. BV1 TaxID=1498500 RepID=UPI0006790AB9|nr:SOS response-associated peptidase [Halorubrum sp. BV1]